MTCCLTHWWLIRDRALPGARIPGRTIINHLRLAAAVQAEAVNPTNVPSCHAVAGKIMQADVPLDAGASVSFSITRVLVPVNAAG